MISLTNKRQWLILLFFAVLVLAIYSNTLNAPYYFDDGRSIGQNPHIRLTELTFEKLTQAAFESICPNRPIANISFALNYYFDQYNVVGYHVVNILIHIVNGILLYFLIKTTLRIPSLRSKYKSYSSIAFFTTLMWLVHPIQTESVTYIVQRMASMATMFYVLSFLLYIKGRLANEGKKRWLYFTGCAVSWILALGTKEISATLPFFVLLYEWYFFQGLSKSWLRRNFAYIIGTLILISIVILLYIGSSPLEGILSGYTHRGFTLTERVLTQFRVIIYYITLLAYPHPGRLNLLHGFELSHSLIDPVTTLVSMGAILGSLGLAFYMAKKEPLISFSILWFFGNLAIESSFLALEIIFEHRTYLPSMFFFLIIIILVYKYIGRDLLKVGLLSTTMLVLCLWTYERNGTWSDPVEFWDDAVRKSPHSARAYVNLARSYIDRKSYQLALTNLKQAIHLDSNLTVAYNNLAGLYIKQLLYDAAVETSRKALDTNARRYDRHITYKNLGVALREQGNISAALDAHLKAIEMVPTNSEAYDCLGSDYLARHQIDLAIEAYRKALKWDPFSHQTYNNLGMAYTAKRDIRKAAEMYTRAIAIKPDFVLAYSNLGSLYLDQRAEKAIPLLQRAIELDPTFADAYNNLGLALIKMGAFEAGISKVERALRLKPNHPDATFNLARVYELTGKYELAVAQYKKSIRLKPDDVHAYQNAGSIYLNHLKDKEQALRLFQKALSIKADHPESNRLKSIINELGKDNRTNE